MRLTQSKKFTLTLSDIISKRLTVGWALTGWQLVITQKKLRVSTEWKSIPQKVTQSRIKISPDNYSPDRLVLHMVDWFLRVVNWILAGLVIMRLCELMLRTCSLETAYNSHKMFSSSSISVRSIGVKVHKLVLNILPSGRFLHSVHFLQQFLVIHQPPVTQQSQENQFLQGDPSGRIKTKTQQLDL